MVFPHFLVHSQSLWLTVVPVLQPPDQPHEENLRLGEFALHLLNTSGKIWTNGSMEITTVLTACTLDDLRMGMERVTSR